MAINIAIHVAALHKGFLATVGKLLASNHNITIIAQNSDVKTSLVRAIPELSSHIDVYSDFKANLDKSDVIRECLKREQMYGELFSMLVAHDRGMGQGYIFNADKYPDIIRSWWSRENKYKRLLEDFVYFEAFVKKYTPDLIICLAHNKVWSVIAEHHNIVYLSLATARLGDRYCWIDNPYLQNEQMVNAIKANINKLHDVKDFDFIDYYQITESKVAHSRINYSYRTAIKLSLEQVFSKTYQKIRQRVKYGRKNESYVFLGWVPPILRKPYMYKYFLKYGQKPSELQENRLVYFPLHLEPEIALLALSPEFNNSMEAIAWISKSLPADTVLVIKEHPFSYGIRSKPYYEHLRKMSNVVFADPRVHSWQWIKAANMVATITGTVGFEAVHFEKPVLSFGKHQVINNLPTVKYVDNYESVRVSVRELLEINSNERIFKISRQALALAQVESSFELVGFHKALKSKDLQLDFAQVAVDNLYEQYAHLVDNQTIREKQRMQVS